MKDTVSCNTAPSERLFSRRDLWKLMLPLVLELLLTLLVGMIDSVMVSSVSEAAVSGVSLVDTVMQLLIYIFAALGTGGAVVAGQYLGSGKRDKACESSEQLIWFSALVSLAVMAVLFALKALILNRFFGQITPEVRGYADVYLTITAFSIPAIAAYEAGAATFRTMGNSKVTMWISLMMNIINVVGNAILIYGVGMATGGAANAIATNISAIQVIPGSAIVLGITTVISRCVGKGDYEQVKYYNRLLITVMYGALFMIDFAIYFALPFILPIYHLSEETALLTTQMVLIHTLGAVLIWPLTFGLPASMRAAGDVRFAMVISIVSMWVFRIGAAYLLAEGLGIGAIGVWLAMAAIWLKLKL